ncbi:MAG: serine protease [Blastocatellia bacterium]
MKKRTPTPAPAKPAYDTQPLLDAVASGVSERINAACDDLRRALFAENNTFTDAAALAVVKKLQGKRLFPQVARLGEAMLLTGCVEPQIRRRYAQALIEQGFLTPALRELESLAADVGPDHGEYAEARGLMGRIYKQRYVNARNPVSAARQRDLRAALSTYYELYKANPGQLLWQGINTVAMLGRAGRDNVAVEGFPAIQSLAHDILKTVLHKPLMHVESWDYATAAEAYVALGETNNALAWLKKYVAMPDTTAFEIASTLRQFEEVWNLDPASEPGQSLITTLRGDMLKAIAQGGKTLTETAATFEKVFGKDSYASLTWFMDGIDKGRGVARIGQNTERGLGTGFLVRGGDFNPAWGDELVLLTNAHVLSEDESELQEPHPSVHPDDVVIIFEGQQRASGIAETYKVKKLLWSSPRRELDATFVSLDQPVKNITPYTIAKRLPAKEANQRLYIIGYPGGGPLSFSIQDNLLLDYEDKGHRIHYRTPTEGGSSGSPVFNAEWKLIGLHHAGSSTMKKLNKQEGQYEANEGIWIQAIKKAVVSA